MGPLDLLNHLLNFAAPALALAATMPVLSRLLLAPTGTQPSWKVQCGANFAACLVVLAAGLWFWERDGKMASYTAMVLVCASVQWCMLRGWRN